MSKQIIKIAKKVITDEINGLEILSKKINFSTTAYIGIENKEKLLSNFKRIQTPAYLKINGLGYDGKGQKIVKTINEAIERDKKFNHCLQKFYF